MGEGNQKMEDSPSKKMEDSAKNVEKDMTFLAVAKSGVVEIMEELNSKVKACDKKGLLLVAMKNIASELSNGTKDTAYLLAAKHGITEIMRELESKLKSVIHETNSNNENALLIAVKNRQPQVVEGLWKGLSMQTFHSINQQVDKDENTILHLAASTIKHNENTAWRISGAAMQMMWDIKWYKVRI
jgi:ankyrin repeat protein